MTDSLIGMAKEELDTPCLVIDLDLLEHNIKRVAETVKAPLRPHTKTHKCPTIAKMQMAAGATGVTCAKVSDAEVLANEGITNILIANQVTGPSRKISRLMELASKSQALSERILSALSKAIKAKTDFDDGDYPDLIKDLNKIRIKRFEGAEIAEFVLYIPNV